MDVQYCGGNCVVISSKALRLVIDDNLEDLGLKSVTRQGDIVLYTGTPGVQKVVPRLSFSGPGEYEVANISIIGIPVQGHIDQPGMRSVTMYKLIVDDVSYLFTGNVHPDISDELLEAVGQIDVMFVPVGGNGYTLDAMGALQVIRKVEPKVVVPTHYADAAIHYPVVQQDLDEVLKNLSMEPKETVNRLRFKSGELSATELVLVLRS